MSNLNLEGLSNYVNKIGPIMPCDKKVKGPKIDSTIAETVGQITDQAHFVIDLSNLPIAEKTLKKMQSLSKKFRDKKNIQISTQKLAADILRFKTLQSFLFETSAIILSIQTKKQSAPYPVPFDIERVSNQPGVKFFQQLSSITNEELSYTLAHIYNSSGIKGISIIKDLIELQLNGPNQSKAQALLIHIDAFLNPLIDQQLSAMFSINDPAISLTELARNINYKFPLMERGSKNQENFSYVTASLVNYLPQLANAKNSNLANHLDTANHLSIKQIDDLQKAIAISYSDPIMEPKDKLLLRECAVALNVLYQRKRAEFNQMSEVRLEFNSNDHNIYAQKALSPVKNKENTIGVINGAPVYTYHEQFKDLNRLTFRDTTEINQDEPIVFSEGTQPNLAATTIFTHIYDAIKSAKSNLSDDSIHQLAQNGFAKFCQASMGDLSDILVVHYTANKKLYYIDKDVIVDQSETVLMGSRVERYMPWQFENQTYGITQIGTEIYFEYLGEINIIEQEDPEKAPIQRIHCRYLIPITTPSDPNILEMKPMISA